MASGTDDEIPRSGAVSVSRSATPAQETDTEEHENTEPKPLDWDDISTLPSPKDICDKIPRGGIKIVDLVFKFQDRIHSTNVPLFIEYIKAIAPVEENRWVKRPSQLPSPDLVARFRKPCKRRKKGDPRLRRDITRHLLSPAMVTFSEGEELIRNSTNILPEYFYRTTHENSATLNRFVNPELLEQHRARPNLALSEDNAFQAIGKFKPLDHLSEDGLQRHVTWNSKVHPSPFISAFDDIRRAEYRANWHHHVSQRIGKRGCVVEIPTTGLVAATVHISVEETETIFTLPRKSKFGIRLGRDIIDTTTMRRNLKIPVWIHESMVPPDRSALPIERLEESDCEMWLSITEMRRADPGFKVACALAHDYEWLACGSIKNTRVKRVMPYDGEKLHVVRGSTPVRSKESAETFLWDWDREMWYLESPCSLKRNLQTSGVEDGEDSGRETAQSWRRVHAHFASIQIGLLCLGHTRLRRASRWTLVVRD